MNTFIKIIFSILILISIYSCNTKKENKVLIIGVDGSRPDAILKANTPNIDSLWKNGAYSFKAKTDEISFSESSINSTKEMQMNRTKFLNQNAKIPN